MDIEFPVGFSDYFGYVWIVQVIDCRKKVMRHMSVETTKNKIGPSLCGVIIQRRRHLMTSPTFFKKSLLVHLCKDDFVRKMGWDEPENEGVRGYKVHQEKACQDLRQG